MMTTDSHWPQPQREREERAMASEAFFLSHNRLVVDRYRSRVLEIFVIFTCESMVVHLIFLPLPLPC